MIRWARRTEARWADGIELGVALVLLLPLAVVCFATTAMISHRAIALADRATRAIEGEGPGVFEGTLRGPSLTSPSGRRGVGWVAHGESRRGRARVAACHGSELGGLAIEDAGGRVAALSIARDQAVHAGGIAIRTRAGSLGVSSDEPLDARELPAGWSETCSCPGERCVYRYHEELLVEGPVTVVGCLRDGRVEPCGDGLDLVAAGDRGALRAQVVREIRSELAWTIAGAILCAGGVGMIGARVASRRSAPR